MDNRRRSSIVTSFASKPTPVHTADRRRSCTFADDVRSFKHQQRGRNLYCGDQVLTSFARDMRCKGSLPSVISDAMPFNALFKRSNSIQFNGIHCPQSKERGYARRKSCTLFDSIIQSRRVLFPDSRRRSVSAVVNCQPKELASRRYTSSSRITSSVDQNRNAVKPANSHVLSPQERMISKRRQSCPVNEIVIRTDMNGVVSIQQQQVGSSEQMHSQFESNHKLNPKFMYERSSGQSKFAGSSDRISNLGCFQDTGIGVHGTRRILLSERIPAENKYRGTLPKSQSYPYKMGSCLAINRERQYGVSDGDQTSSHSSFHERIGSEEQNVFKSQTNSQYLCDDDASHGTDGQSDAEQNHGPAFKTNLSPNVNHGPAFKTNLSPNVNPTMPFRLDRSPPSKQRKDNSSELASSSNQNASGQSHPLATQAAVCTNESQLSKQQQFDRNEPLVWKQYLSPLNESADDDNDVDTASSKPSSAPVRIANAKMALTDSGTETACCGNDSSQIPTQPTNERNVHIFLTSSKMKNKHKADADTVLISFCVSPACITFSVLQINYRSGRMRGGIPFAKVVIMDSRLANCNENYYRQHYFIVELGQEVHFCFPDLMSLEFMTLSIEMSQQQNKKEKCLGCVEIKLADQDKLTDVILWKTLQKPIRQNTWGNFFSCFSGRTLRTTI